MTTWGCGIGTAGSRNIIVAGSGSLVPRFPRLVLTGAYLSVVFLLPHNDSRRSGVVALGSGKAAVIAQGR